MKKQQTEGRMVALIVAAISLVLTNFLNNNVVIITVCMTIIALAGQGILGDPIIPCISVRSVCKKTHAKLLFFSASEKVGLYLRTFALSTREEFLPRGRCLISPG